jgi:hypothetical protein
MVFCLFKLIRSGILTLLLNDYIKRTFPQEHEKILINMSLKCIYIFSKFQIISFKLKNQIREFAEKKPYLKKILNDIYKNEITPVTENDICQIKGISMYIKYFTKITDVDFVHNDNCFYILSDNINRVNNCVNKIVMHTLLYTSENYEVSNIRFILLELKYKENTYKINLKSEESNYYIVNNILDKKFFIYYLNNYQVCNLTENDINNITKFDIKLIDHDVNVRELEITDNKFIIIKKDEYIY